LRIPVNPATCSEAFRPSDPEDSGHLFQAMVATTHRSAATLAVIS